ncbi:hypothetical protein H4219_003886 [Mycoemilia scoparia]|uniref:CobW/HypB/UreG nucleotide-binding domain-containing protein n=1 Tax=Mycoemilia scoparia TaxID=417184 RepID=A0A9W8A002_9FUNG|nr:hypothetical protein H4219_003886 [Mycoemilia scoparia]
MTVNSKTKVVQNNDQAHSPHSTPVTVFTGFLGAGKTTIIMDIIKSMPKDYNIVMLKNEFGDAEADSALMRESHIQVQEMTNGCLCCVLVGQMRSALLELKEKYNPDRIVVETSGSAFPAPIAWQIRQMEDDGFHLDAILTVIDAINFRGYEDTSYTAKMQAKYTDLILLNKWEMVSERELDVVIDHVNDLNTDTPKVRVTKGSSVDPSLIFGIDTKLFELSNKDGASNNEKDPQSLAHQKNEVDLIEVSKLASLASVTEEVESVTYFQADKFIAFLSQLSPSEVYRIKGIVRVSGLPSDIETTGGLGQELSAQPKQAPRSSQINNTPSFYILNHAFGRYSFTPVKDYLDSSKVNSNDSTSKVLRVTVMGVDLRFLVKKFKDGLSLQDSEYKTYWARRV